ncbi:helix-turn-helix domain-containing protein, partial [bacterium]|nr:helix-turn-helix domain-containing protein [bacterium]
MEAQETIRLTTREIDRLKILHQVKQGKLTRKQAAEMLGISRRHVIRLLRRIRKEGDRGISHGLRGQPSNHRLDEKLLSRALEWIWKRLKDFGPTFVKEKLEEDHDIHLSVSRVRRLMIDSGIWKAKKHRPRH